MPKADKEPLKAAQLTRISPGKHVAFCCLPLILPILFAAGLFRRGYWLLLPAAFLLVITPFLDWVTGWQDDGRFEKEEFSAVHAFFLRWNTRIYAMFYITAVTFTVVSLSRFTQLEIGFLIASCSLLGGICFAAAHELLHAKESFDQILQRIVTTFLFYPHYKLIHIRSHHVHAGTDHDENTAWLNESVYSYIRRTIPGSMVRCWQMEARNYKTAGAGILKNKMYWYAAGQLALLAGLFFISGYRGVLFYLAQTAGAHVVLESVNYIQHYGLMRRKEEGEYEKTAAEHSWDTYHFFSSYATFRVGHHSYHHIAVKPYYLLAPEVKAPKLPVGYFWAIAMVFVPQWWRKVINPRIEVVPERQPVLTAAVSSKPA